MSYAVVRFIEESNNGDVVVSEVPIGWLSADRKECRWPPNNSKIYITKNRPASDNWPTYPVEVECVCDTLSEAKMKALSCSSDEEGRQRGKGCRAPKPVKVYSPENPRRQGVKAPSLPPLMEDGYVDYFLQKYPVAVPVDDQQGEDEDNNNIYERNLTDLGSGSQTPTNSEILSQPLRSVSKTSRATQTEKTDLGDIDLRSLLHSIIRTQAEHSIALEEIKQTLVKEKQGAEASEVEMVFDFDLPCDSLDSLESLESYVNTHRSQFVKFLQKIGGNDGRDNTCRCLRSIFTNSLGEICSWTGQKSNYPVCNLKIMEFIFDVVHKKFSITRKDFEFYTKEWFRHSRQRRERDDKKKGK
ncbi:uncharacterized protein LOC123321583 isoform X2 [Coccinella septempunctata]|uniref:uncharacterized protein LOC123321583 isoform X2 n=1 Tax=Coccinella septempunctata TaxID=41139 RepID=UPI001D07E157|nr:uncharacterized protein LOC123321583 isoform X2 [Coccinella septempunctata]XP_044765190.1 uncharacterized protein LOC123321583 isoform X2 [Coccinella septempunctata]